MPASNLLGLPVSEATAQLDALGEPYRIVKTAPPRRQMVGERLRVVGLRETPGQLVLVVAHEYHGPDSQA